jgi:hypothetical protein
MYQQRSAKPSQLGGLTLASLNVKRHVSGPELFLTSYPMVLRLSEMPTMLTGAVNYNADSFGAATVVRLTRSLNTLLRTMTSEYINEHSDVRVSSLVPSM